MDLGLKTTDVSVGLERSLFNLHDADERIGVVLKDSDDRVGLVVKEDLASGLDLILINKRTDVNIKLGPHRRRNNRMIVIDDLLQ